MNNEADLKSDPTFFTLLTRSWGSTTQHHPIPNPNQHRCSSLPHYDAMFHRLRSYTLRDTLILSFSSLMSNWVNFVSLRRGIGHIFFQLHSQASMNFFQGNFFWTRSWFQSVEREDNGMNMGNILQLRYCRLKQWYHEPSITWRQKQQIFPLARRNCPGEEILSAGAASPSSHQPIFQANVHLTEHC